MTVRVAIDCMGGDHGVSVTLPAALAFLDAHPDAQLILVGQREALETALTRAGRAAEAQSESPDARLRIHHASEVVGMDEPVAQAPRTKFLPSKGECRLIWISVTASFFLPFKSSPLPNVSLMAALRCTLSVVQAASFCRSQ